ncbi:type I-B CRISPR-associated protein Cas7/Csh2 [uncultured Clostridium sp.]|uniref:type I-B CRISPR-associated protein Cas7/Csh2 n=1 Tax=uncultured Clostridium sp. TaxID=59620 RepID=UPI0026204E6A|nr:type I-B CRISPR-associated protein Cas7/Csh2 [uncultured Clostridium sp.]
MIKNRSEIIYLYDIVDNNPNGDPIDSNKPRIDEETGINIVTEVRLKRTIRDYLKNYKDKEIFVREIRDENDKVQDGKTRAKDFGTNKEEVSKNVLDKCIDVRLFGATIPLDKASVTFTGPVQFNMGRSLNKVELKRIKGTGAFASGAGKDNKTFREEYILPYSLIGFYGIINENASKFTNLTDDDVNLLLDGIWNGTKNLISRSKVGQLPRLLIKVDYKEGNFHIGGLLNKVKIKSEIDDEAIRGTNDYKLDLTKLREILVKNKEKIEKVYFAIDNDIELICNNEIVSIEAIVEGIQREELNF